MRSFAASIIIFSACATFIAAALIQHSGTNLFLNGVGLVVGAVGLIGWFTASGATSPKD